MSCGYPTRPLIVACAGGELLRKLAEESMRMAIPEVTVISTYAMDETAPEPFMLPPALLEFPSEAPRETRNQRRIREKHERKVSKQAKYRQRTNGGAK